MKHYLVFAFDTYYPSGGWHDFIGSTNSLDEARTMEENFADEALRCEGARSDWRQIVDTSSMQVVEETEPWRPA